MCAIPVTTWSFARLTGAGIRLLCHALQFAFKSIAYYIRRATLINVRNRINTWLTKSK
jgi:hypothetical protein